VVRVVVGVSPAAQGNELTSVVVAASDVEVRVRVLMEFVVVGDRGGYGQRRWKRW
jgi:hypothetical protein